MYLGFWLHHNTLTISINKINISKLQLIFQLGKSQNRAKSKTPAEREKIKKGMKSTIKAKHLHGIRARDAEVKVMDDILQYCKVRFVICDLFQQFPIQT